MAPVPPRGTVCGLPVALSTVVIDPLLKDTAVGLNKRVTVQVAFASRDGGQLCVPLYSPVIEILLISSGNSPVLEMATGWGALVLPTATNPN